MATKTAKPTKKVKPDPSSEKDRNRIGNCARTSDSVARLKQVQN